MCINRSLYVSQVRGLRCWGEATHGGKMASSSVWAWPNSPYVGYGYAVCYLFFFFFFSVQIEKRGLYRWPGVSNVSKMRVGWWTNSSRWQVGKQCCCCFPVWSAREDESQSWWTVVVNTSTYYWNLLGQRFQQRKDGSGCPPRWNSDSHRIWHSW